MPDAGGVVLIRLGAYGMAFVAGLDLRGEAGGAVPESYWRHGRRWAVGGTIATVIPLANLYFMVFKP